MLFCCEEVIKTSKLHKEREGGRETEREGGRERETETVGRGERRREKGQTHSPLLLRTKQKNCIREGEGRESERG